MVGGSIAMFHGGEVVLNSKTSVTYDLGVAESLEGIHWTAIKSLGCNEVSV